MSRRVAPSSLVACLALVVALCGTTLAGYAAGKARGDQLVRKHSLSGNRLRADTITGAQVAEGSLGAVPRADHADHADHADRADRTPLPAVTALPLGPGWAALDDHTAPGYWVDSSGLVHLVGAAHRTTGSSLTIGTVPAGLRPVLLVEFPAYTYAGAPGAVQVEELGGVDLVSGNAAFVSLEGVSYRVG
jgi:hypothetical protein